jgi:hypothetical protein
LSTGMMSIEAATELGRIIAMAHRIGNEKGLRDLLGARRNGNRAGECRPDRQTRITDRDRAASVWTALAAGQLLTKCEWSGVASAGWIGAAGSDPIPMRSTLVVDTRDSEATVGGVLHFPRQIWRHP